MIRNTSSNIVSTLSLVSLSKNFLANRWEFKLAAKREYVEPAAYIDTIERKAIIRNTPAMLDESGNEVAPAGTEVSDFEALISDYVSLESISFSTILAHAENIGIFVEYEDDTGDLWNGESLPEGLLVADWEADIQVAVGFLRKYNGVNYRCIQKHTTQASWTPDVSPSLWVVAPTIGGSGYPDWVQPTGSQDAYDVDAIVTHNGFNWKSLVNANVWEPSDASPTLWEKLV